MKRVISLEFKSIVLAGLVAVGIVVPSARALAQPSNSVEATFYSIRHYAGDSAVRDPYHTFYVVTQDQWERDLAELPPELGPASRDTDGNWGAPADGLRLSVRFHRREFVPGEPVSAMVLLRNLDSAQRNFWFNGGIGSFDSATSREAGNKMFAYTLRHGTNVLTWPSPKSHSHRTGAGGYSVQLCRQGLIQSNPGPWELPGHSQIAIFVRLDSIFNLSELGEYSIQLRREERLLGSLAKTNIASGWATFRIVDKLSPSEVAATNAFARTRQQVLQEWRATQSKAHERFSATNKTPSEAMPGMTNKPSEK